MRGEHVHRLLDLVDVSSPRGRSERSINPDLLFALLCGVGGGAKARKT